MKVKPLIYYYPSQIYLIDDNMAFLQNLQISLSDKFNCSYETNLEKAADVIKTNQQKQLALFNDITTPEEHVQPDEAFDDYGSHVTYSLDKIKKILSNPSRNNHISVIVIDYSMPQMSGIDFCEAIADLPVKKIMLTGEADSQIAIDAFNKKLIDGFVSKGSANLIQELSFMIQEQQQSYFSSLQQGLIDGVSGHLKQAGIIDAYNDLVSKIIKEHNISEYYMTDSKGSYLMLGENGEEHFLQVYSPDELEMYHDIAINSDAPETVINDLVQYRKAPLFKHEDKNYMPVETWSKYMNDVIKFKTGYGFYYGFK